MFCVFKNNGNDAVAIKRSPGTHVPFTLQALCVCSFIIFLISQKINIKKAAASRVSCKVSSCQKSNSNFFVCAHNCDKIE